MLRRLSLIALLLALAGTAAAPPADTTAKLATPDEVFILAGQSNMLGRGLPLSAGEPSDPRLLVWRGSWVVASDPLGTPTDPLNGIGPGMTFGLGAIGHLPTKTIGLVQCAISGTPMKLWLPGGTAYDACMDQVSAAGGLVAGILFLQGEKDALVKAKAVLWEDRFDQMLAALRSTFGPDVPLILAQIGKLDPAVFRYQNIVRDAQIHAGNNNWKVAPIYTEDLPTEDGLHFTTDSFKTVGSRFAAAWWALTNGVPPPPPPDFTVDAAPSAAPLPEGQSVQFTVSYTPLNGFAGTPSLSVSGLPSHSTATFAPATLSGGGSSTLTVTATTSTPLGSYDLTIRGASGSISRTAHTTLDVLPPIPDFAPAVSPGALHTKHGVPRSVTFKFKISPRFGYTGSVDLSVSTLPPSAGGSFSASTVQILEKAARTTYLLTTTAATPRGTYPLTFTVTDGSTTHTVGVQVVVG